MAGKKQTRQYLTLDQIEAALIKSKGIMTAAGESLGVSRSTVSERVRRSERLQKVIDDQRRTVGDFAESKLFTAIKEGNLSAIIFLFEVQRRLLRKTEDRRRCQDGLRADDRPDQCN